MKYLGIIFIFSKQLHLNTSSGLGTKELHTNLKIDFNMTNLLHESKGVLLNETCYHSQFYLDSLHDKSYISLNWPHE